VDGQYCDRNAENLKELEQNHWIIDQNPFLTTSTADSFLGRTMTLIHFVIGISKDFEEFVHLCYSLQRWSLIQGGPSGGKLYICHGRSTDYTIYC